MKQVRRNDEKQGMVGKGNGEYYVGEEPKKGGEMRGKGKKREGDKGERIGG